MIQQSRSFVRTVLAIGLATVMLGACDWAQVGFDAGRTNFNPSEPTLSPATVSELHQRWTISVPGASSQQPLTANGLVYFAVPGSRVAAVSATTGAPAWSTTTDVTSVFAVADGQVYATTQQGLSAFGARTGAEIWSITLPIHSPQSGQLGFSTGPVVANGLVYVVGLDSRVYAYDAATGTLDWSVAPTSRTLLPGLIVANGVAYASAFDSTSGPNIFALNAITGATIWSATTAWPFAFVSMAAGDKAYVVSVNCQASSSGYQCGIQTQARDATDGSVDWEDAGGGYPLAMGDGIMYRYPSDAIDSATGAQLWWHNDSPSAAAIAHGVIYASDGSGLGAFDAATGAELWSAPLLTEGTYGGPAVANGALYVATGDSLVAFGL
jgi:outer membrane protein assembly factor BamB